MQNSDSKKDEDEYALVKVLKQLLSYLSLSLHNACFF